MHHCTWKNTGLALKSEIWHRILFQVSNQTLCRRFFKVLWVVKLKLAESRRHNRIMPCLTTFSPFVKPKHFPPLSLSSSPTLPFPSKICHARVTQYQAWVNLLCASQQPNSNSSNDPLSAEDYLMKWETAIMAIFTTYLALSRISIPKEKCEKYRFIAFLGSQGRIICDYTLYSYFQTRISKKMCFFLWKEEKSSAAV